MGKAGGVHSKRKRSTGAMRQACKGASQRCAVGKVSEALAAHEGGEAQTVVRKSRITALKCVYDEVNVACDRWRMGEYVTLRTVISTQCHQQLVIIPNNTTTN